MFADVFGCFTLFPMLVTGALSKWYLSQVRTVCHDYMMVKILFSPKIKTEPINVHNYPGVMSFIFFLLFEQF